MNRMKIVVVERDADLQELVRTIVGDDNEVRCIGSAREALKELAREPADVVLADLDLPDMTGGQFARQLKVLSPSTRIVLTSTDWWWLELAAWPGVEILRKPFSAAQLRGQLCTEGCETCLAIERPS